MRAKVVLVLMAVCLAFDVRGESPVGDGVVNLIRNGSFELESNPGLADGWYASQYSGEWRKWCCMGLPDYVKELVGRENLPTITVDPTTAVHGDKSLRIVNPSKKLIRSPAQVDIRNPLPAPDTTYAFSFHVKGARPNMRVTLELSGMAPKQSFTITEEWASYSFTFKTAPDMRPYARHLFVLSGGPGTYWLDAVQLEIGDTVHPFVEHKLSKHDLMKRKAEGK